MSTKNTNEQTQIVIVSSDNRAEIFLNAGKEIFNSVLDNAVFEAPKWQIFGFENFLSILKDMAAKIKY